MKYKVVVFDWDGTLIDSVEHIAGSLHNAAQAMGLPLRPMQAYRDIIGLGMMEALEKLYPGIEPSEIEDLRERYARHFFSREVLPTSLFPGVAELLETLQSAGVGLAVATGKSRRGLDRALLSSGLQAYFGCTRCADETRSKPDPLMLRQILEHYGVGPAQTVMVGDTVYDLDMAQRASIPAIGVTWGVHDVDELAAFDPVAIVDGIDDLAAALS